MDFLAFVILLPLVVFVHELGHFALARRHGVRVDAFSIGFGPALFKWRDRHGTEWRISLVPLGGYVKMFGQNDMPERAGTRAASIRGLGRAERRRHFEFKTRLQRASIIAAGPAMNYVFGLLVFFVIFALVGVPRTPAVVSRVLPGSPALAAGIMEGDSLESIGGIRISRARDIARSLGSSGGRPVDVVVKRDGRELRLELRPELEGSRYVLGVVYAMKLEDYKRPGVPGALAAAASEVWSITADTTRSLGEILAGRRSSKDLGGIISIAQISGNALAGGLYTFLYLVALMSVSLGLFNLFPIPMLDGGYLSIYALEAAIRRDIPERVKEGLFMAGFALVMAMLLLSNFNDVMRLLGR